MSANRMRRLEHLEAIHLGVTSDEDRENDAFLGWLPGEDLDRLWELGERMGEAQDAARKLQTMDAFQAESAAILEFRQACDELRDTYLQAGGTK